MDSRMGLFGLAGMLARVGSRSNIGESSLPYLVNFESLTVDESALGESLMAGSIEAGTPELKGNACRDVSEVPRKPLSNFLAEDEHDQPIGDGVFLLDEGSSSGRRRPAHQEQRRLHLEAERQNFTDKMKLHPDAHTQESDYPSPARSCDDIQCPASLLPKSTTGMQQQDDGPQALHGCLEEQQEQQVVDDDDEDGREPAGASENAVAAEPDRDDDVADTSPEHHGDSEVITDIIWGGAGMEQTLSGGAHEVEFATSGMEQTLSGGALEVEVATSGMEQTLSGGAHEVEVATSGMEQPLSGSTHEVEVATLDFLPEWRPEMAAADEMLRGSSEKSTAPVLSDNPGQPMEMEVPNLGGQIQDVEQEEAQESCPPAQSGRSGRKHDLHGHASSGETRNILQGSSGSRKCSFQGCQKSARGRSNTCIRHGGGKRCQVPGCIRSAESCTGRCISHGGGRRCQFPQCTRGAQGSTPYCKGHGGGRRCEVVGCTKGAEGRTLRCKAHGGGKRCTFEGGRCPKSVHGATMFCIAHGGGKRCVAEGCQKSARGRTSFCVRHGGGRRCGRPGCTKSAQGRTDLCKAHGGGRRCTWLVDGVVCDKSVRGGRMSYCRLHGPLVADQCVRGGGGVSDVLRLSQPTDPTQQPPVVAVKVATPVLHRLTPLTPAVGWGRGGISPSLFSKLTNLDGQTAGAVGPAQSVPDSDPAPMVDGSPRFVLPRAHMGTTTSMCGEVGARGQQVGVLAEDEAGDYVMEDEGSKHGDKSASRSATVATTEVPGGPRDRRVSAVGEGVQGSFLRMLTSEDEMDVGSEARYGGEDAEMAELEVSGSGRGEVGSWRSYGSAVAWSSRARGVGMRGEEVMGRQQSPLIPPMLLVPPSMEREQLEEQRLQEEDWQRHMQMWEEQAGMWQDRQHVVSKGSFDWSADSGTPRAEGSGTTTPSLEVEHRWQYPGLGPKSLEGQGRVGAGGAAARQSFGGDMAGGREGGAVHQAAAGVREPKVHGGGLYGPFLGSLREMGGPRGGRGGAGGMSGGSWGGVERPMYVPGRGSHWSQRHEAVEGNQTQQRRMTFEEAMGVGMGIAVAMGLCPPPPAPDYE